MLSIVLLILKIIGIVLLSILGFILFLLLLVLFVPIRYKLQFERIGREDDPPAIVHGKITWLLHILNIHADYPAEAYVRVRVFFFTLFQLPKKQEKQSSKKKEKKKNSKEKKAKNKDEEVDDRPNESKRPGESIDKNDSEHSNKTETSDLSMNSNEFNHENSDILDSEDKDKKESLSDKWSNIKENITGKIEVISKKIEQIEDKKETLVNQIEHYQKIIESKAFQESFQLCKKELVGILKSIGPRKVDVFLEVGMDDPATTATILSYYGMFYAYLYNKVRLMGNFEESIIRGKGIIKGKITIARLLLAGIRIYFNKYIKKLLRMLKKEEVKNGRK